jgi:hypothetical protein
VLAFDGGLQHRGEPITRGVRYIIAAFLFVENSGVEVSDEADTLPHVGATAAAPPAAAEEECAAHPAKRSFAETIGLSASSSGSQEPKRAAFSFNFE